MKDIELALKLKQGHLCSLMIRAALNKPMVNSLVHFVSKRNNSKFTSYDLAVAEIFQSSFIYIYHQISYTCSYCKNIPVIAFIQINKCTITCRCLFCRLFTYFHMPADVK